MSLHIGDKILEVNGQPVKDTSIENIDKLIQSSDRVLQLTIEHDPHRFVQPMPTPSTSSSSLATTATTNTNSEKLFASGQPVISNIEQRQIDTNGTSASGNDSNILCVNKKSASLKESPSSKSERAFVKHHSDAEANDRKAYISGAKARQLRNSKNLNLNCAMSTNSLKEQKERCSSMSRLLDENHPPNSEFYDLSRTKSFRVDAQELTPRIFRASDLVQGKACSSEF